MLICINKPKGFTSHDVVNKVRRFTNESRVGHGGTLDPFATGVLVIGIGRVSTKKLHHVLKNSEKEYVAVLELGKTSDTGDPTGAIQIGADPSHISIAKIRSVLRSFTGDIAQIPPAYSAVKVRGIPSYKLARKGIIQTLSPRAVRIEHMEILAWLPPLLSICVVCSSGTYVRVLAQDIGQALGTGAYLTQLTRTRVGRFTIADCLPLTEEAIQEKISSPENL